MSSGKIPYVVVLPLKNDAEPLRKYEYYFEADQRDVLDNTAWERACQTALRKYGVTTSRKKPEQVRAELYELTIKDGAQERISRGTRTVTPPFTEMTQDEYNEAMAQAVIVLPQEFQTFVRGQAWDRGHSAGYEEVVSIAQELATALAVSVEGYLKRIGSPRVSL